MLEGQYATTLFSAPDQVVEPQRLSGKRSLIGHPHDDDAVYYLELPPT